MNEPLDFATEPERQEWLTKNAEYFTVIRRQNMRYMRLERPTLKEAEQTAQQILDTDPTARLLIYAVRGVHSTFVKYVRADL